MPPPRTLAREPVQALEDAVVLAHCRSGTRPVEAVLRKYEHLRIPRTAAIVRNSRQSGKLLQLAGVGIVP